MSTPWTRARDWAAHLADEGAGRRKLALASFLESTFVPVPLEVLVVPLMVAHPRSALRIAWAIWGGCLLGATVFYLLALWLYDPLVAPLMEAAGWSGALDDLRARLGEEGVFGAVFLISLTPVPFQVATLGAGAAGANFLVFIAAVATSRGIRYFGLALLAWWLGPHVNRVLTSKRWTIGALVVLLGLAWAGWYLLR